MSTSTLLFLVAAGCGVLFGLLAGDGQMRDGVPLLDESRTLERRVHAGRAGVRAPGY